MNSVLQLDDIVVIDNNVIQDFFELDRIDLIFSAFKSVYIPKTVFDAEISDNVKSKLKDFAFTTINITTELGYETLSMLNTDRKYRRLSECDRNVIASAKEIGSFCGSNDSPVRKACMDFDVRFIGSLGVLKLNYIKGILSIDEIETITSLLLSEETSCYITEEVIIGFLSDLKEQGDV